MTPDYLTRFEMRSAFDDDFDGVPADRADAPTLRHLAQDADRPDLNATPGTFAGGHDASNAASLIS